MSADLQPLLLDALLAGGVLLLLVVDLFLKDTSKAVLADLTALIFVGLFGLSFAVDTSGSAFDGSYVGGAWPLFFKRLFFAIGALTALGSRDFVAERFSRRQGEFYMLLASCVLGMTLLPGAQNLLLLLVAFELMGLPLSMLAAWAKTEDLKGQDRDAAEGGMKLYVVGAASTGVTFFGLSLVYGMSGHLDLAGLAAAPGSPLLTLGMFLTLAGMSFKIGAVPFHMWVPDTYQGSPTPFVAFLSVAPKAAGFAALAAVFVKGFGSAAASWAPALLAITTLTLVVGNLMAIPQSNVKRLLAFSGVAHIGYMLMALAIGTGEATGVLLFYLAGYAATNIGAFLVVNAVGGRDADVSIPLFNGFSRRSPGLAACLLIFLLSLAGIPFVVGFWAKLYVFIEAWRAGLGWLVFLGALLAVVGLWYYLQIAYAAYIRPPATDREQPVAVDLRTRLAIGVCLVAVVGMGAWPTPFLENAMAAAKAFIAH
jgi:NADH-quinone oxidoreductase subunit N